MITVQVNVERLVRLQRLVKEARVILRANIGGMSSKLEDIHEEIDSIITNKPDRREGPSVKP